MFTLYYFLNMIIYQEMTFCVVCEMPGEKEIMCGFADELLRKSKIKISKYDVLSFGISDEDTLFINVIEKEEK